MEGPIGLMPRASSCGLIHLGWVSSLLAISVSVMCALRNAMIRDREKARERPPSAINVFPRPSGSRRCQTTAAEVDDIQR